jgi:flagellar biosynthesis anti-sigma factor FlgM
MKIHPVHVIKQFETVQKKQPANSAQKADRAMEGDKVAFSEKLREIQSSQSDMSVDTERQARIDSVKARIADGTYAPDSFKVAQSLLKYIAESGNHE